MQYAVVMGPGSGNVVQRSTRFAVEDNPTRRFESRKLVIFQLRRIW
jgi:hypothetical protein